MARRAGIQPFQWTPWLDGQILRSRAAGATWRQVALLVGMPFHATIERGRRLGARRHVPSFRMRPPLLTRSRTPLPAGHPYSWGLITHGTLLEGVPYPYPVFR